MNGTAHPDPASLSAPLPVSKEVQATGLKVVLNILDKWGCGPAQVQLILQVSRPAFYKYRRNPAGASLSGDQVERISYLLNIHQALRTIFRNPENIYGFMAMPNDNPYFNGRSPLAVISTGVFADLYETCQRIDALRGAQW